jgi:hypothetical protein
MEQVFYRLHVRSHDYITRYVPQRVRWATEVTLLAGALCMVSLLVVLHVSHVLPHDGGCLKDLVPQMRAGIDGAPPPAQALPYDILRVRVVPPERSELREAFAQLYEFWGGAMPGGPAGRGDRSGARASPSSWALGWALGLGGGRVDELQAAACPSQGGQGGAGGDGATDCAEEEMRTFYFALEKGWLLISPEERARHRVVEKTVEVSGELYKACMAPLTHVAENRRRTGGGGAGESRSSVTSLLLRGLLQSVLGYETVVVHALIALSGGRGFLSVRGPFSSDIYDLGTAAEYSVVASGARAGAPEGADDAGDGSGRRYDASTIGKLVGYKLGVIFTALFLFFVTTPLVSFTLRETQERMLKFTFLLHHHVRHRQSYVALIAAHMVDSLVYIPIMVGMVFFLFEFFDDQLLAFVVLSGVWICEVYSAISVRTPQSIRFFPRFFFLYFLAFHVYFFSYPFGGFSHLAVLAAFVLPMLHAMVHFWNRFEAPALSGGSITAMQPRMPVLPVFPRWTYPEPANGDRGRGGGGGALVREGRGGGGGGEGDGEDRGAHHREGHSPPPLASSSAAPSSTLAVAMTAGRMAGNGSGQTAIPIPQRPTISTGAGAAAALPSSSPPPVAAAFSGVNPP